MGGTDESDRADVNRSDEIALSAETMRERTDTSRLRMWLLISANRWLLAGVVSVGTFLVLVLLEAVGPSSIRKLLAGTTVSSVFSSIIIATVTSVTLVLTVAQLVLSQKIDPLGDQREKMAEEISFRDEVEDAAGMGVSPPEPGGFLRALVESSSERARTLERTVTDGRDSAVDEAIVAFTDHVVTHGREVSDEIEGAEFGTFELLLPVLNYNYSWKIYTARRLLESNADTLSEESRAALEALIRTLRFFGPAREYFKGLYFEWEIINVARAMLYSAMPALGVAAYMILVFEPRALPNTTVGIDNAFLFVSAVYTVELLPFAVLLTYILRVLSVVKWTLAIGPFVLRETNRSADEEF